MNNPSTPQSAKCEYCHGQHAVSDCPEIAKLLKEKGLLRAASPQDWFEDAEHENGKYWNTCQQCGRNFVGHKRRVTCKLCTTPGASDPQATPETDEFFRPWRLKMLQDDASKELFDSACCFARTLERAKLAAETEVFVWAESSDAHSKIAFERQEQIDSLSEQLAMANRRMAYLQSRVVEVREPLMYGSRHLFYASPDQEDGDDSSPSDLPEKIDKHLPKSTPPSPVLYCQTCGHGQEFVNPRPCEAFCDQCKRFLFFRTEKPEGKQP